MQIRYVETADFWIQKKTSREPMHFMHHHNSFELFYIISGEREYFIEDEFFKMKAGDLVIVPANALHRTDGKGALRFLINFSQAYLEKFLTTDMISALPIFKPAVFRTSEEQRGRLHAKFNSLFTEYSSRAETGYIESDSAIAARFLEILLTVLNSENFYVRELSSDSRTEKIVKYINENYASISNIEEIASHFYISKYHLCRIFSQSLGTGLIAYLNTIKIRSASKMLKETDLSITEIALKCGFNSPSYFCKIFKSEKGVSPKDFRQ